LARVKAMGGWRGGGGDGQGVSTSNWTMAWWWWHASSAELGGDDGGAVVSLGCGESESEARQSE